MATITNAEKYGRDITRLGNISKFAVNKDGFPMACSFQNCKECAISNYPCVDDTYSLLAKVDFLNELSTVPLTNMELYAGQILSNNGINGFALLRDRETIGICGEINCEDCFFFKHNDTPCIENKINWLESNSIKLTYEEKEFLHMFDGGEIKKALGVLYYREDETCETSRLPFNKFIFDDFEENVWYDIEELV